MAGQQNEYDNYNTQTSGRLFGSAMFGFNKEEVLEYLEELADENFQQQEAAERRIQEMNQRIQTLEAALENAPAGEGLDTEQLAQQQAQIDELQALHNDALQQLQAAAEAAQQAETTAQQLREDLHTTQQENQWLREEYQNNDKHIADLQRQLEAAAAGQLADEQNEQLRRQLSEAQQEIEQLHAGGTDGTEAAELREQLLAAQDQIAVLQTRLDDAAVGMTDAATQQELNSLHAQLVAAHDEIGSLRRQIVRGTAQPDPETMRHIEALQQENEELRAQIEELQTYEEEWTEEDERRDAAERTASVILEEANEQAERIRQEAILERDRIHRQIGSSTGGLTESITNLREEVSGVEGDVSGILEAVQGALAEVLSALGRTEQNLSTLDIQVERFPSTAPAVPKQQVVYFQPSQTGGTAGAPTPGYAKSGFKPVKAEDKSAGKPFRPSFTTSASGAYWPKGSEAEALPVMDAATDEKLRNLSETLVDTLRQMLN